MKKPYRWEVGDDNVTRHYFDGKEVEPNEYRRLVFAWEREHRNDDVDTRGDRPKGVYITKQFPAGIYHPQLAIHPKQKTNGDPAARYTSFKDLERKAAALGMNCNRESR